MRPSERLYYGAAKIIHFLNFSKFRHFMAFYMAFFSAFDCGIFCKKEGVPMPARPP